MEGKEPSRKMDLFATYFELPSWKGHVITGVLISLEAVIKISCRRGIPSVTFISPRPARWNVFSLINGNIFR